jgi:hypothetical protein
MIAATTGVVLLLATSARAQLPSCGSVDYANDIYQNGNLQRVWLQANTFREGAWCPVELQTEAWVWGVGSAVVGRGVYSSPVMLGTLVHFWGKWESQGKHWVIFTSFPQTWVYFADSHDETTVNPSGPYQPPRGSVRPRRGSTTGTASRASGRRGSVPSRSPDVGLSSSTICRRRCSVAPRRARITSGTCRHENRICGA